MELVFTDKCKGFSGALSKKDSYYFVMRNGKCFARHNSNCAPKPGEHLRFIFKAAQFVQHNPFVRDIKVPGNELRHALIDAGHPEVKLRKSLGAICFGADFILFIKDIWKL